MDFKFCEERIFFVGGEAITCRVGNDGSTPCMGNPLDGVFQCGPAVGNKAWFVFCEVLSKHFGGVFANACFNQKTRKVSA